MQKRPAQAGSVSRQTRVKIEKSAWRRRRAVIVLEAIFEADLMAEPHGSASIPV
jgi:hypothetical protein